MNIVQANKKWPSIEAAVQRISGIALADPTSAFSQYCATGVHSKVAVHCTKNSEHGSWHTRITSLKEGHGCPHCGKKKSGKTRSLGVKSGQTYVDELYSRVGGKLITLLAEGESVPALRVTSELIVIIADVEKFGQNLVPKKLVQTLIAENPGAILFWSDEWKANQELIVTKIEHISKRSNLDVIYARKCEVREITNRMTAGLLNKHHLQGSVVAQINLGLYHGEHLVAVQTFSSPRILMSQNKGKDTTGEYELVRYATDSDFRVVGGASKLMNHFIKVWKPVKIFSMSDNRWSAGNMYQQLGFSCARSNSIEYYYVVDGVRKHRWGFRKDILKLKVPDYDPIRTEYDTVFNVMGHDRVWGAGTTKWEYVLTNSELAV
jgi:hypothetical protein